MTTPAGNMFDENGQTIHEEATPQHQTHQGENQSEELETQDPNSEELRASTDAGASDGAGAGKYQIGDRFFNTLEEAHAFATSQLSTLEQENLVSNAYRQGIQDAIARGESPQSVTPTAPEEDDFNEEEYFSNPKEFLKNYAEKIKTQTAQSIKQELSVKEQSDQIWREFTERHPALADFREDTEQFVGQNLQTVQAIISTKGQGAAYDYIALKMKEKFSRYAQAVRPEKRLPNTSAGATPAAGGSSVTPRPTAKKPLSFAEQLRSIKKS